ncbi:hypothetical protein [Carboxylicivirga sp. M1479]|uniref:hypothetical protein n=2 Tax=Carboxylicivirga TaxID=1628153 RepID=UPI001177EA6D|nr:hypothetical protein [Carboxylicivirga sp. M1479]TRX61088.1 hypothetical protein FNN09_20470 [Carboxylicivirga sp. M1479]
MAELFKDLYSKKFFAILSKALNEVVSDFNQEQFIDDIYDSEWKSKEFKQRMYHVSFVLNNYLSDNFPKAVEQLHELIAEFNKKINDLIFA